MMNLPESVSASSRYEPLRKGLTPAMQAPGASGSNVKSGVGRFAMIDPPDKFADWTAAHKTFAGSQLRRCTLKPSDCIQLPADLKAVLAAFGWRFGTEPVHKSPPAAWKL